MIIIKPTGYRFTVGLSLRNDVMDKKYLSLLAKEFPTIDSVVSEIVNLSAIRSLPKGTEYFFSDIHDSCLRGGIG